MDCIRSRSTGPRRLLGLFRFRLRTLLGIITGILVLLAIWTTYLESYRIQERAAKASGAAYNIDPVGPSWVEPITGQVGNVTVVILEKPPPQPDGRAHLRRLTELREIWT